MSITVKKEECQDDAAIIIVRNVKKSGAFDRIKKEALDKIKKTTEYQVSRDFLLNMVRINFERQTKERKYPPSLAERRNHLKTMIRNGTMFDSLSNSIQQSAAFKEACQKLFSEADKEVPTFFPELKFNERTNEWEVPGQERAETPNSFLPSYYYNFPTNTNTPCSSFNGNNYHLMDNSEAMEHGAMDMELDTDSDSSTSTLSAEPSDSVDNSRESEPKSFINLGLPPPPPPPAL